MRNGSFFIPREQIFPFFNPGEMNKQEGLYLCWETDPSIARRVLPPQLKLLNPEHPVATVYVVNIREPTFTSWYMEAGLMLLCRYGETSGGYFLNLQLSGPGAAMGMCSGREFSGLPKKICERIVVERAGDCAQALIESKGKRIFDVAVELGAYNDTRAEQFYGDAAPGRQSRGSCLLFQYEQRFGDGHLMFPKMTLSNYDSVTDYETWERASIKTIEMEPSLDDPWAELAVVRPIGAAYSKNSNRVLGVSKLADFDGKEADNLISYLLSGRWDRSTISGGSQRYGQF